MGRSWWAEAGDGVWVRRHEELDLSLGLVLGERSCLVIDTGGDEGQGEEFAAAVRELTPLPWSVVITHAHFDHCFGTAAFGECDVWAHPECGEALTVTAEDQRVEWAAHYDSAGDAETGRRIREARIVVPASAPDVVDLGGRIAALIPLGHGHTGHDLVVHVPDAGVVFSGDLIEQGAPPQFGDAYPLEWPGALDRIIGLEPRVVVPGHGQPVGLEFVREQRDEVRVVAQVCARVWAGESGDITGPFPEDTMREAVGRKPSSVPHGPGA